MGAPAMRSFLRRDPFAGDHGRARELAARRIDEALDIADEAWLERHLATCGECRAIAAEYEEQRGLLRAQRDVQPVPPRDLWARTAAAIESGDTRGRARPASQWSGRLAMAPIVGLLVIVIAVGVGLLNGVALFPPGNAPSVGGGVGATPIPLTAGDVQVLSRSGGTLELSTRKIDAVCPVGVEACGNTGTTDNTALSELGDLGPFDAYLSPTEDRIVVVQRGSNASGVYVVPVHATTAPTPTVSTPPATPAVTDSPVPASPSATPEPSGGPGETASPSPTASDVTGTDAPPPSATPTPSATADTSPEPTTTPPESAPPSSTPTTSPEATPEPTSSPAESPVAPSPSPSVAVTPSADGTLEIARDVILVGSVSGYSADGMRFAFAARPADGSVGPDVYVWQTTDTVARPVTTDHASLFAGWLGDRLLVSRIDDGRPVNVALDPETDRETPVGTRQMWLPAVSPDQETAAWWEGSVVHGSDGYAWVPGGGRLVLGSWPDGSGRRQLLAAGPLVDWHVRWDESGTALGVWVARGKPGSAGRLSVYLVDAKTGLVDLARPLFAEEPAFEGFSLRSGRVAWTAPNESGGRTVKVFAWSGTARGQIELPTTDGVTVIH